MDATSEKPVPLYDVFAVSIKTGERRLMANKKTAENAEAFIKIAIMRRGVEEEFYISEAAHD